MGPWKEHGNNTGGFFRCDIYKGSGAKTNKEEKKQSDATTWASEVAQFKPQVGCESWLRSGPGSLPLPGLDPGTA